MAEAASDLAELLGRVRTGDESAFEALYDQTSAKLYGVILRIVRGRELADDILQDTFLRIWQRASSFDPASGGPMTWMHAIARNAAIDVVRRRGPTGPASTVPELDPAPDPERKLVMEDQLGYCLGRLSKPHLECVVLAYCNGYSREELAQHFSAQVGTVKTWLHRALLTLRQCLSVL